MNGGFSSLMKMKHRFAAGGPWKTSNARQPGVRSHFRAQAARVTLAASSLQPLLAGQPHGEGLDHRPGAWAV